MCVVVAAFPVYADTRSKLERALNAPHSPPRSTRPRSASPPVESAASIPSADISAPRARPASAVSRHSRAGPSSFKVSEESKKRSLQRLNAMRPSSASARSTSQGAQTMEVASVSAVKGDRTLMTQAFDAPSERATSAIVAAIDAPSGRAESSHVDVAEVDWADDSRATDGLEVVVGKLRHREQQLAEQRKVAESLRSKVAAVTEQLRAREDAVSQMEEQLRKLQLESVTRPWRTKPVAAGAESGAAKQPPASAAGSAGSLRSTDVRTPAATASRTGAKSSDAVQTFAERLPIDAPSQVMSRCYFVCACSRLRVNTRCVCGACCAGVRTCVACMVCGFMSCFSSFPACRLIRTQPHLCQRSCTMRSKNLNMCVAG